METTLKVTGMSCQHCVMAVKKALGQLNGIQNVEVDLSKGEVKFQNTQNVGAVELRGAVEKAGFKVESA